MANDDSLGLDGVARPIEELGRPDLVRAQLIERAGE
jgi:hypothetical protein